MWIYGELSGHGEFVSDAVHRQEMARCVAGISQFAAKLDDDLVEGASGAVVSLTPDFGQQSVAAEDFARMAVEELEELKLAWCQVEHLVVASELEGSRTDFAGTDTEGGVGGRAWSGNAIGGASKQRLDAGQEFPDPEWLGHVVVGAGVEPDDLVHFLAFGGEHQDGGADASLAEEAADFVPVDLGEHDIQEDEAGSLALDRLEGAIAAKADRGFEALRSEQFLQTQANAGIVFDDENARFHGVGAGVRLGLAESGIVCHPADLRW